MIDDNQTRERNAADLIAYLLASEENEKTYRRGYRQGWQVAVERLGDLLFDRHFSPEDAFTRLQRHGETALTQWQMVDATQRFEPPICPLISLGQAEVDRAYLELASEGEES